MKKIFILLSAIFLLNSYLYSFDNIEYLNNLVKNGYTDVAIEFAKKNSNDLKVKKFLYTLLIDKKMFKKLTNFIPENSKNLTDLEFLCKAYIFLNNFIKADILINKIKKLDIKKYEELLNFEKGIIFYKKFDLSNSLKLLLKIKNPYLPVRDIIAQIYILNDNIKNALKYRPLSPSLEAEIYYKAGNYKKSIEILRKMRKLSQKDKIILYNSNIKLGQYNNIPMINWSKNNFTKNIELLINYKKFDEAKAILISLDDSYLKFYYLGKIYFLLGNFKLSLKNFFKALELDKNSEVLFYIAECYKHQKNYILSAKYFNEVINRADIPDLYISALYNVAMSYYFMGEFNKAEKNYKLYLNNEQSKLKHIKDAIFFLAQSLEYQGNYIDAIKFYSQYRELISDKEKIRKIDFKMAKLWDNLENYQFEIEIYKKYYPVKSKREIFILKNLGNIYQKIGDYKSSNVFFNEYLDKIDKNLPDILIKIALNYLYLNKIDKAKKIFLNIIEDSNITIFREEALFYMGKIYMEQNNFSLAKVYFQRLYSNSLNSPIAQKALKYICYVAYKLNDKNTLESYLQQLSFPYEFIQSFKIDIKQFCSMVDCKNVLTIQLPDEKQYKYFKKLYASLHSKNKKELLELLNLNQFHGIDNIAYFYIGNILMEKGMENEAMLAFNKFLNNNYNPLFKYEYSRALKPLIKYYFANNDFEKIISLSPVYSKLDIDKELSFFIGYSAYKFKLKNQAKKYLTKFILKSNNGKKIFNASFYLDRLGFLEEAEQGYLKADQLLNDKNKIKLELYYWLGEIYAKQNREDIAINYFLKIKLMYPFDIKWTPTAAFKIAQIFEKQQKYKKALKEYTYIFTKLKENDPRKNYVKNRIDKLRERLNENN